MSTRQIEINPSALPPVQPAISGCSAFTRLDLAGPQEGSRRHWRAHFMARTPPCNSQSFFLSTTSVGDACAPKAAGSWQGVAA
jgi:hypothetical protein